jgi:Domain of unknown function (DUF4173)
MSDQHPSPERPPGAQPPPGWMPPAPPPPRARAASPTPPLPPRAVVAALVAGLLGAVAVAGEAMGLGVVLCALAVGIAGRLGRSRPLDWWSRLWLALAAGLATTALLRDADWVVVPSLLAALALASLALAGGTSWAGVASGLARIVPRLGPGPAALARGIGNVVPDAGSAAPALRGTALAVGLLTVFGVLFASGDAAFAQLAGDALPDVEIAEALPGQVLWFLVAGSVAAALATVGRAEPAPAGGGASPAAGGGRLAPVEWGIALGALNALFVAFVAIQAAVLFGRHDHVLNTAGLTYAEYAREGFVQLLVAAALTLAVLAAALRWARTETSVQRIVLRGLLAALGLLTLVVLASAAHRLDLYQDAFGSTRTRLGAAATIVWLGAVLALVLAATASDRFRWLPRACVLATALTMLGFALYDPDRRIAERNVDRYEKTGSIDVYFLTELSADAVPTLTELPPAVRAHPLVDERAQLRGDDGWAGFNFARERARDALAEIAP